MLTILAMSNISIQRRKIKGPMSLDRLAFNKLTTQRQRSNFFKLATRKQRFNVHGLATLPVQRLTTLQIFSSPNSKELLSSSFYPRVQYEGIQEHRWVLDILSQ